MCIIHHLCAYRHERIKTKIRPYIFRHVTGNVFLFVWPQAELYVWQSEVAIIIDTNTFNDIRKCVH